MIRRPPRSTPLSLHDALPIYWDIDMPNQFEAADRIARNRGFSRAIRDRKSTRLNSSHANISYAVFCLTTQLEVILRMLVEKRLYGFSYAQSEQFSSHAFVLRQ